MWAWLIPLIAGVVGAVGKMASNKNASTQYDASAAANDYNAAVLRQRADQTRGITEAKNLAYRRNSDLVLGKQRAAIAESGTGLDGSNADVERQSMVMRELDSLNIMYEGDLQARGFEAAATLEDYNAAMNRRQGRVTSAMGPLAAAGPLLSGAGQSYGSYGSRAGNNQNGLEG